MQKGKPPARSQFAQAGRPTLGQVLDAFEKRYQAGTLELLTRDERCAQLDQTIANAEAFEKRNFGKKVRPSTNPMDIP